MSKMKKTRKPGGGRKKLKPEYDAGKNLKEQMESAVALYDSEMSLQAIGEELGLNPIKVRKLLITADVYESEVAEKVQATFQEYRETQDYKTSILSTANTLKLSKASVTSYLPYRKGVYFPSTAEKGKISVGAERQRRYRAMKRWRADPTEENFWGMVVSYAGVGFKTYSGLPFSYEIKKGRNGEYTKELWIDRREKSKSLAWSSVLLALKNIKGEVVDRPKALGDIRGVTYIYGMFYRFGLIDVPDEVKEKMGHTTYSSKNRRSIQQLNAFGKAEMTFFNSEEISDAFGYMTPIMQIFAEARNNNSPIDSVYSQGTHVLNIEAALSNNGCSFYRILILLQLARKTGLLCEKISWYCAILESLFAIERNHKKNVSEMTAAFITDTEQEKMEVIHSMRMAYKIRSEFVHGSVSSLVGSNAQAELGKLSSEVDSYVRRALRKAFSDENINYEETTEDKKRVREYLRNHWPC